MARSKDYRSFPTHVQKQILKRDKYRCRTCGRRGPQRGGVIDLEAHHMEEDPTEIDRNHPENGTTLCIPCHHLFTHRPTADGLSFDLEEVAAEVNLLYKDIGILMYLYEDGPATTSEIQEATSCSSKTATIERLWTLMSVDRAVASLEEPLVDKDVETDEWGAPCDIGATIRGRIPETEQERLDRLKGELLRRLLDAGVDRSTVAEFFDRTPRATFYIEKRAGAVGFPVNDDSSANALMREDEFERVVDVISRMLGSVGGVQSNE